MSHTQLAAMLAEAASSGSASSAPMMSPPTNSHPIPKAMSPPTMQPIIDVLLKTNGLIETQNKLLGEGANRINRTLKEIAETEDKQLEHWKKANAQGATAMFLFGRLESRLATLVNQLADQNVDGNQEPPIGSAGHEWGDSDASWKWH